MIKRDDDDKIIEEDNIFIIELITNNCALCIHIQLLTNNSIFQVDLFAKFGDIAQLVKAPATRCVYLCSPKTIYDSLTTQVEEFQLPG